MPTNGFAYSGWTFNGWAESSTETSGSKDSTAKLTGSKTFYATWMRPAISYTLIFKGNGGSGTDIKKTCIIPVAYNGNEQGTTCPITLPENTFTYDGWTFIGWATDSEKTSGISGTTIDVQSNDTYYAIWKKASKTYTVTYNANGGSGNTNPSACTIPAVYNGDEQETSCTVTLATSNGFTRSGYTFNGWATSATATSGESLGARVTLTYNKTYYAAWKDSQNPTLSCTITKNDSTSGISVNVTASDNSGSLTNDPTGTYTGLKSDQTYTATDATGNSASCTVEVDQVGVASYTKKVYACESVTWSSPTTTYVQTCTAVTAAEALANNASSYTSCNAISTQANQASQVCTKNGLTAPCYAKGTYTRTGCSSYSSTASSTTTETTCTASSNAYNKTTCTIASYLYSGTVMN